MHRCVSCWSLLSFRIFTKIYYIETVHCAVVHAWKRLPSQLNTVLISHVSLQRWLGCYTALLMGEDLSPLLTRDLRERLSSLLLSLSDSKSALHEIPPTRWFRFHFSDIAAWSVGSAGDDSRLASSSIFWCRFISSMILSSRATRFCLLRGVFVLPATRKIPLQHSVRNRLQWVALSSAET